MSDVIKANISDLTPDPRNANKGTQRGRGMLDKSLRQYGAGRSILLDKHNRIIAGNKTTEAAADIGLNDVVIVESDGTKLIAVKRTDLDLDDTVARELAYADNRIAQVDLDWDADRMLADVQNGINLEQFFAGYGDNDITKEWEGMPEFEQENLQGIIVRVHFLNEDNRAEFFNKLGIRFTDKTNSIWYPERPEEIKDQLGTGLVYSES